MTKEEVIKAIKEILDKDENFKGANFKVNFIDKQIKPSTS